MLSEEEFELFRQDIIQNMSFETNPADYIFDELGIGKRMEELAKKDHAIFLELCKRLLVDEKKEVRQGTLLALSYNRMPRDFELAQLLIEHSLDEKELLDNVLYALAHIATHAVFLTLYRYALEGSAWALSGIGRLAQTDEEIQAIIHTARKYLTAPDYRLRASALTILNQRSKIEIEEDLVLDAVRLYKDENFISVLKKATPLKMLPKLTELATTVPVNSTAFEYLSKTIIVLEKRELTLHNE